MSNQALDGITNPPIDALLDKAGSKYSLVLYAAKRARQINAYYSQLGEGLLEYVGPLVETYVHEKPLSIALREINEGLLTIENLEPNHSSELKPPCFPVVERFCLVSQVEYLPTSLVICFVVYKIMDL